MLHPRVTFYMEPTVSDRGRCYQFFIDGVLAFEHVVPNERFFWPKFALINIRGCLTKPFTSVVSDIGVMEIGTISYKAHAWRLAHGV